MLVLQRKRPFPVRDDLIMGVAISPDGTLLATAGGYVDAKASRGEIKLWSLPEGKLLATLHECRNIARCVAFRPDGKYLAATSGDRTVRVWQLPGLEALVLRGHTRVPTSLGFSPDGKFLASGSANQGSGSAARSGGGELMCRTTAGWKLEWSQPEAAGVWSLAFAPDSKEIVFGQRSIVIRKPNGVNEEIHPSPKAYVRNLAFSPDGSTFAATTDKGIVLLDGKTHEVRATIKSKAERLWCLAFTRDGRALASGHGDGTVRLWDPATENEISTLHWGIEHVRAVAFAPDGMTAAAGGSGDANLVVWDVQ